MAFARFIYFVTIDKMERLNCFQRTTQIDKFVEFDGELRFLPEGRDRSCRTSTEKSSWEIDATLTTTLLAMNDYVGHIR